MIALRFDERYGDQRVFACTRDSMRDDIRRAEEIKIKFKDGYTPLLEPRAVRAYVKDRQRLTQSKP